MQQFETLPLVLAQLAIYLATTIYDVCCCIEFRKEIINGQACQPAPACRLSGGQFFNIDKKRLRKERLPYFISK